jgi:1-phosphatidylinositol-4-phosphate 5-kinase
VNWGHQNPDGDCICRDSSSALLQTSNDGQSEVSGMSNTVFEREYMQGVLIVERIKQYSEISHNKTKKQNKFSMKQAKKNSFIGVFQERRSHYLKLNLQLGIR